MAPKKLRQHMVNGYIVRSLLPHEMRFPKVAKLLQVRDRKGSEVAQRSSGGARVVVDACRVDLDDITAHSSSDSCDTFG